MRYALTMKLAARTLDKARLGELAAPKQEPCASRNCVLD